MSDSYAVIVQDLQNDVISEGGAFAETGSPLHAKEQGVVDNVARLTSAARRAGVPVIHVWFVVEPGAKGLQTNAPLFAGVHELGALVRGSWGAAPVAGLEPQDGDFVVEKTRMNGFYGTKLDAILRGLGVTHLALAGAFTNMSVEHTARHGADAGYQVTVCTDGCSSINADWHQAALNYALTNVASTAACDEVIAAFS